MIPYANETEKPTKEVLEEEFNYELNKKINWYDRILLNRPAKVILGLILVAIIIPILLYQFVLFASLNLPPSDGYSFGSCLLPRESRLLCGDGSPLAENCHPHCCFDANNNMCYHRYPSRFSYILSRDWDEGVDLQPRVATVPFSGRNSLHNIRVSIDEVSSTHMSITYYNPLELTLNGSRIANKTYSYEFLTPELNIEIRENDRVLFNTMRGPLIAADDIWEVVFKLTDESMFGLGEIPLLKNTQKVLYAHNMEPSLMPLIFAQSNDSYHGLLLDTAAPTEIRITEDNQIAVRVITKLGIKLHVFMGPEPKDIMRDVRKFVGYQNKLDYWMLGAHVCSQLSETTNESFEDLNNFLLTTAGNLPFESHCGISPIVFQNDCNTEIIEYIEKGAELLNNSKKRFIPHVSPHVKKANDSFILCGDNSTDFFIKNEGFSDIYAGLINSTPVFYPDNKNITNNFLKILWHYERPIHGLFLENSWPLDESEKNFNNTYRVLPYFNKEFEHAFQHTLAWDSKLSNGDLYMYEHNDYGNNFAKTMKHFTTEDVPMWSTSQRLHADVMANSQNVDASWSNLQKELVVSALSGVSGNWLWSSPICGDTENFNKYTQVSLCIKWYQAATFLPMIKIHSKGVARFPSAFNGTDRTLMLSALKNRLSLLPYFYTVLQEGPLLRPMFYQYPRKMNIMNLKSQFNVGDDLMIIPNLLPDQNFVHIWMPSGTWYEFWSGLKIEVDEDETVSMSSTDSDFLVLIRGGSIVPTQKNVKLTAEETRMESEFSLTIALDYNASSNAYFANGKMYLSANMTLHFEADLLQMTITPEEEDFTSFCDNTRVWTNKIIAIDVYGLEDEFNNYDNYLHLTTDIDLCLLANNTQIVHEFK